MGLRSKRTISPQTWGTIQTCSTKQLGTISGPKLQRYQWGLQASLTASEGGGKGSPWLRIGSVLPQITSSQGTCPAAFIWLICEAQGPAGVTQIYTTQQVQLITQESGPPLSSAHRTPSENLSSRRRFHMKGAADRAEPRGLPPFLLVFFLSEKISSRFHSRLCHTSLLAV